MTGELGRYPTCLLRWRWVTMIGSLIIVGQGGSVVAHTLTSPPVLQNIASVPNSVEVNLTAAPTRLSLAPGGTTDVWAYNGQVPGPTLEAREGDRVIVHFHNQLPEPTTVHWHGLHVPVTADGDPMSPVPPGGSFDYRFTLQPGTAGTYWYHPHPHHQTGFQVAKGLFGAIIIRAADDPLPACFAEKLLLLSDNQFEQDGAIAEPGHHDFVNGREGSVLFVNGQIQPTIMIRSGEVQRWRIVNASAARYYRLALPGHTFLHVGSDGGLFERPVACADILIAPSERVEVLVQGSGAPASRSLLQALPYDRYTAEFRPEDWQQPRELLTLQYSINPSVQPPDIPAVLRPVVALDPARATITHNLVLADGRINGQRFSMQRVDLSAVLGDVAIWQIRNQDAMDHPFHLHGFSFQVLDHDSVPEPFPAWKDTVNVRKGETVRFIVEYRDYPGQWMFHCHILDHEDHGMMGILEVQ
jgi:suppressor of ftsI